MPFFAELKRRNVYRVAALYIIVSWLILQVTDVLTSVLALPDWTGKLVFSLLLIGFPVCLVLAWAFELTPDGVRRENPGTASEIASRPKRSRIDYLIFGLLLTALAYFGWQQGWQDTREQDTAGDIRSIAVLPLDNLMNDPDQAFFVAGMHEALITELSRIEALKVISRTSASAFQGSGKSVPEIASQLGVDAVVEGSALRAGDVVRITVQLIDANTDRHLWANNFDRPLRDILALYGEVTREIANQIRITITPDEQAHLAAANPVDPEAYELFLRGRYLCDTWGPSEMRQGIELLQDAISREPGNASAHAQLALCLQYTAFFGYEKPLAIHSRARAAAALAVQLDKMSAEARVALAGVMYYLELNPRVAIGEVDRALELNPSSVRALLHASWLLAESGQFTNALERNRRALALDPFSTVVNDAMAQLYYLRRDFDNAIVYYRKALELNSGDPSLHYHLAWPLEQQGRFPEAIALHRKAIELSGGSALYRAALAHALGRAGEMDEAARILGELIGDESASPFDIAIAHLGLGQYEPALDYLEQAYEARDSHIIYINRGPRFDPLRNNPRFTGLLERIDWLESDEPPPGIGSPGH